MKLTITYFVLLFTFCFSFAQSYSSPNGVSYDPNNDRWLVSNFNGGPIISDDGQGNLSFFGGWANYGLEIMGNTVFTPSGNRVYSYDLTTGEQVTFEVITDIVIFLNGLTSDGVNNIYVVDSGAGGIYKVDFSNLSNPSFTFLASSVGDAFGLLYDGDNNRLIFATRGSNAAIKQLDLSNNQVSTITTAIPQTSYGIDVDGAGNYYLSSSNPGKITKFDSNFQNPEIVITPTLDDPRFIEINQATV